MPPAVRCVELPGKGGHAQLTQGDVRPGRGAAREVADDPEHLRMRLGRDEGDARLLSRATGLDIDADLADLCQNGEKFIDRNFRVIPGTPAAASALVVHGVPKKCLHSTLAASHPKLIARVYPVGAAAHATGRTQDGGGRGGSGDSHAGSHRLEFRQNNHAVRKVGALNLVDAPVRLLTLAIAVNDFPTLCTMEQWALNGRTTIGIVLQQYTATGFNIVRRRRVLLCRRSALGLDIAHGRMMGSQAVERAHGRLTLDSYKKALDIRKTVSWVGVRVGTRLPKK